LALIQELQLTEWINQTNMWQYGNGRDQRIVGSGTVENNQFGD